MATPSEAADQCGKPDQHMDPSSEICSIFRTGQSRPSASRHRLAAIATLCSLDSNSLTTGGIEQIDTGGFKIEPEPIARLKANTWRQPRRDGCAIDKARNNHRFGASWLDVNHA